MYDKGNMERGVMRREARNSTGTVMEKVQEEEEDSTADSLTEKTADEIFDRMQKGENVSLSTLLEGIVNAVMERERDYFLQSTEDYANGFYMRKLHMWTWRFNFYHFRRSKIEQNWRRIFTTCASFGGGQGVRIC